MSKSKSLTEVLPDTSKKAVSQSPDSFNEAIRQETLRRLDEIGSDRSKILARLNQLEKEWDIERTLETNASIVALAGIGLGLGVNKKWLLLPTIVAGFLFQHALQGWCPPLPLFRKMGVRTQREIDNERAILMARLGELEGLEKASSTEAMEKIEGPLH